MLCLARERRKYDITERRDEERHATKDAGAFSLPPSADEAGGKRLNVRRMASDDA
jgi:hypothetical protein